MSRRDRRRLEELEERVEVMTRREQHLQATERSWLHKCAIILRPFQIVFGVVFLLVTLLIFLSLLLTRCVSPDYYVIYRGLSGKNYSFADLYLSLAMALVVVLEGI